MIQCTFFCPTDFRMTTLFSLFSRSSEQSLFTCFVDRVSSACETATISHGAFKHVEMLHPVYLKFWKWVAAIPGEEDSKQALCLFQHTTSPQNHLPASHTVIGFFQICPGTA